MKEFVDTTGEPRRLNTSFRCRRLLRLSIEILFQHFSPKHEDELVVSLSPPPLASVSFFVFFSSAQVAGYAIGDIMNK